MKRRAGEGEEEEEEGERGLYSKWASLA